MTVAARTRRNASFGLVAIVLGPLLSWAMAAPSAAAEARLLQTVPARGSVVAPAPSSLRMVFDTQLDTDRPFVAVIAPGGARVESGEPTVEGNTAVQQLRPGLAPGQYRVVVRVASATGQPIRGRWNFSVRSASVPLPTTAKATPKVVATPSPSALHEGHEPSDMPSHDLEGMGHDLGVGGMHPSAHTAAANEVGMVLPAMVVIGLVVVVVTGFTVISSSARPRSGPGKSPLDPAAAGPALRPRWLEERERP